MLRAIRAGLQTFQDTLSEPNAQPQAAAQRQPAPQQQANQRVNAVAQAAVKPLSTPAPQSKFPRITSKEEFIVLYKKGLLEAYAKNAVLHESKDVGQAIYEAVELCKNVEVIEKIKNRDERMAAYYHNLERLGGLFMFYLIQCRNADRSPPKPIQPASLGEAPDLIAQLKKLG